MKLWVTRNQSDQKGMLGGHKGVSFSLHAQVALTEAEKSLLERYKGVDSTTLTLVGIPSNKQQQTRVTVASLLAGQWFNTGDVTVLMAAEQEIKNGCENFRNLLDVMATFGGREEYDFDTNV